MKILIAGATGTLGLPLVKALSAKNHEITGTTRSSEKTKILEEAGAIPAIADALSFRSLELAIKSAKPDCVVHLLTAIPKKGPTRAKHMDATNILRIEGTKNLLRASIAADVKRIVGESFIFVYGYGDHGGNKITEDYTILIKQKNWQQKIVGGIQSLEEQFLEANSRNLIETISLRFGGFYGEDSPSTLNIIKMIKKGRAPVVKGVNGIFSWIHTKDAVNAIVAAIENGSPGNAYNIVDDNPVSLNEFILFAADFIKAKKPISLPFWLMKLIFPYVAAGFSTRLLVSNEKAKRELNWKLEFPAYKNGLKYVIKELMIKDLI